jgi:hypothetical protein
MTMEERFLRLILASGRRYWMQITRYPIARKSDSVALLNGTTLYSKSDHGTGYVRVSRANHGDCEVRLVL